MKPILEIKGISKKFRIQHTHLPYMSMRDSIISAFKRSKQADEDFFALKNVSFNIEKGESVGIIGKNGAGKSTLLKILSKITPPTSGKIICRGRIASLLEVGTGFHAELSGRENIFLNGSILGMKRKEIERQFDAIVEFAGVDKFIDTPLKHYSSGMQLRLAFAVAAFLEPEIMIIDEVLAVGDAEFQKKCIGKMSEVSKSGRTILFVSHNLAQLKSFCPKAILLEEGKLTMNDTTDEVISRYMGGMSKDTGTDIDKLPRMGLRHDSLRFKQIHIRNADAIYENDPIEIALTFSCTEKIEGLTIGVSMTDMFNNNLIECRSDKQITMNHAIGNNTITLQFPARLKSGIYSINVGARSMKTHLEYVPGAGRIHILSRDVKVLEEWDKPSNGILITDAEWKMI